MLRRLSAIFCAGLVAWPAGAQTGLPEAFRDNLKKAAAAGPQLSLSQQFVVFDQPESILRPIALDKARTNLMRVDPALLTISCERIKRALLTELGARDQWQGQINVSLHRAQSLDEPVVIGSAQNGASWTYYPDMPDTVERSRLVSGVVNTLLLEMANRASARPAEIPTWLAEGLTRDLMEASELGLVIAPPERRDFGLSASSLFFNGVKSNPLAAAHEKLRTRPPLTLEQLSWPAEGQLDGEAGEAYQDSAQLLVHDLTQFDDGRACLCNLIGNLGRYFNWQMAFLDAFHGHFASLLEFEKWWALRLVTFTGRDLRQTWSHEESWKKLDEMMRATVEVRTVTDELPLRTEVTLQSVIREWEFAQQVALMNERVQQLFVLRTRVSQDLVYLVDDYRQALEAYTKKRSKYLVGHRAKIQAITGLDKVAQEMLQVLDALDARRQELRAAPQNAPPITASVDSSH